MPPYQRDAAAVAAAASNDQEEDDHASPLSEHEEEAPDADSNTDAGLKEEAAMLTDTDKHSRPVAAPVPWWRRPRRGDDCAITTITSTSTRATSARSDGGDGDGAGDNVTSSSATVHTGKDDTNDCGGDGGRGRQENTAAPLMEETLNDGDAAAAAGPKVPSTPGPLSSWWKRRGDILERDGAKEGQDEGPSAAAAAAAATAAAVAKEQEETEDMKEDCTSVDEEANAETEQNKASRPSATNEDREDREEEAVSEEEPRILIDQEHESAASNANLISEAKQDDRDEDGERQLDERATTTTTTPPTPVLPTPPTPSIPPTPENGRAAGERKKNPLLVIAAAAPWLLRPREAHQQPPPQPSNKKSGDHSSNGGGGQEEDAESKEEGDVGGHEDTNTDQTATEAIAGCTSQRGDDGQQRLDWFGRQDRFGRQDPVCPRTEAKDKAKDKAKEVAETMTMTSLDSIAMRQLDEMASWHYWNRDGSTRQTPRNQDRQRRRAKERQEKGDSVGAKGAHILLGILTPFDFRGQDESSRQRPAAAASSSPDDKDANKTTNDRRRVGTRDGPPKPDAEPTSNHRNNPTNTNPANLRMRNWWRRTRHGLNRAANTAKRATVGVTGAAMVTIGVPLLIFPVPGPGVACLVGGLYVLSTEFDCTKDALDGARDRFADVLKVVGLGRGGSARPPILEWEDVAIHRPLPGFIPDPMPLRSTSRTLLLPAPQAEEEEEEEEEAEWPELKLRQRLGLEAIDVDVDRESTELEEEGEDANKIEEELQTMTRETLAALD